jgi:bifunctional non-homologous end joining protein LigD
MKIASDKPDVQSGRSTIFIAPCLAVPASIPPVGPQWVTEIKYDGYRIQAHISSGAVTLLSRSGQDWSAKFARIRTELSELPVVSAIIDGEAIVENARGVPDFHALQREINNGSSARIAFVAFDLLEHDGRDLRNRPLRERKRQLERILGKHPNSAFLRFAAHFADQANDVMQHACGLGLEGIVCKRIDRPYRSGRSGDWVKVKCIVSEPFVIGGYVLLKGRQDAVGSLSLGFFRNNEFIYAGRVGTGFSAEEAGKIWQALQPARRKTPPFTTLLDREQKAGVAWVEPQLVVEIAHRGWTHDDVLRHAVFKRLRSDVSARNTTAPASLRGSG